MPNKYYPRKDILQIDPSEDPYISTNSNEYNTDNIPFKMGSETKVGPIYTIPKNITVYRGEKINPETSKPTTGDYSPKLTSRFFTKDKELAEQYATREGGLGGLYKADISEKDFNIGKKILNKTSKYDLGNDIILPKKNLKDVELEMKDTINLNNIFKKGGLVSKGNGKVMKHKLKHTKKY